MADTSSRRDPRSVVTPDAFEVTSELLGLPLAAPGRRLMAILLDLVFIGALTLLTRSFALLLGIVAAGFFVRMGLKRTTSRGTVFGRTMRGSVGCLGVLIGLVTLVVWLAGRSGPGGSSADGAGVAAAALDARTAGASAAGAAATESPIESRETAAIADEVSLYDTPGALEAYAALLRSGREGEMDVARRQALERRLATVVAADTLAELRRRAAALEDVAAARQEALDRAETQLEEATSGGLLRWLRGVLDELGFGFGWASLYLTVMLSWWNGQTLGKRLVGIRVVRLDGQPMNWWVAFERAGGYAAGFATGLLGFAQIYWDANRQAIHDRIVGTVVIVEGADRVIALGAAQ